MEESLKSCIVFPITTFGPTVVFTEIIKHQQVYIEVNENFIKQTWRSRYVIAGANGAQTLVVPVQKANSKQLMRDVKIDNTVPWQRNHWRSIEAAYNKSAFFEYYKDLLLPLFTDKFDLMIDYNWATLLYLHKHLQINTVLLKTIMYETDYDFDYRNFEQIKFVEPIPYNQVFMYKRKFIPYTSALDLLFSLGPKSSQYLTNSALH